MSTAVRLLILLYVVAGRMNPGQVCACVGYHTPWTELHNPIPVQQKNGHGAEDMVALEPSRRELSKMWCLFYLACGGIRALQSVQGCVVSCATYGSLLCGIVDSALGLLVLGDRMFVVVVFVM